MNSSGVTSTEKDNKLQCENISNQITNNPENDDMQNNFDKEGTLLNQSIKDKYTTMTRCNLRSNSKRKQSENSDTERQSKLRKIHTDDTDFSRVKDECSSNKLHQNDDQKLENLSQICGENYDYHKHSNIDSDIPEGLKESVQVFSKIDHLASSFREEISSDIDEDRTLNTGYIVDTTSIVVRDTEKLAGEETKVGSHPNDSGSITVTQTEEKSYLYRLLREGENIKEGLVAKNPYNDSISIISHVTKGSNGSASKYISTCSTLEKALNWRYLKQRSKYKNGTMTIVKIDKSKLPNSVQVKNLTTEDLRNQEIKYVRQQHSMLEIEEFHRLAQKHSEVLLVGKVRPECLEKC